MIRKMITVPSEYGVAHKVATQFVRTANEYQSLLRISRGSDSVNAKSLLGIIAMGIKQGEHVVLTAEGSDEIEAMDALLHSLDQYRTEKP